MLDSLDFILKYWYILVTTGNYTTRLVEHQNLRCPSQHQQLCMYLCVPQKRWKGYDFLSWLMHD